MPTLKWFNELDAIIRDNLPMVTMFNYKQEWVNEQITNETNDFFDEDFD